MRICWFNDNRLGLDPLIANLDRLKPAILAAAEGASTFPVNDVKFLSPVASPTKIIGTPTNYRDHIAEADRQREVFGRRYSGTIEEQGLFLKATSALVGPGEGVRLRFPERRTDHEMELGVVIGQRASNIRKEEALDYVAGYSIALDMVVRGTQDRSFRKSIDTYAVLGPWLVTADEVPDPQNLDFFLAVNGEVKQKSNTSLMIMDLRTQISWASSYYTLWPGDIIMSGTCSGVSQVASGDVLHCEIDKVASCDVHILA